MSLTVPGLLAMSQAEVDDLFRRSDPGPVPSGEGEGTVIIAPGTTLSVVAAELARLLAWKGKVFDPAKCALLNEIGPFGHLGVSATIDLGTSLFDGRPAIVLDYSQSALLARRIRDELRQVGPGLYLGIAWWGEDKVLDFSLQFPA